MAASRSRFYRDDYRLGPSAPGRAIVGPASGDASMDRIDCYLLARRLGSLCLFFGLLVPVKSAQPEGQQRANHDLVVQDFRGNVALAPGLKRVGVDAEQYAHAEK